MEARMREAAEQLAKSAEGQNTLANLLLWFEASGLKLDQHNKQAALLLIQCAWSGKAGTALQVMYDAVRTPAGIRPERTDWDRDDPDIHGH